MAVVTIVDNECPGEPGSFLGSRMPALPGEVNGALEVDLTPAGDARLQWRLGGIDTRGRYFQDLARGSVRIPFPHRTVAPAHDIDLVMPQFPVLATLWIEAIKSDGPVVARNFLHFFVTNGSPPAREELPRLLVVRGAPADWAASEWSAGLRSSC